MLELYAPFDQPPRSGASEVPTHCRPYEHRSLLLLLKNIPVVLDGQSLILPPLSVLALSVQEALVLHGRREPAIRDQEKGISPFF